MKPKMYDCPKKITVDQNRHRLEVSQKTQRSTKHFSSKNKDLGGRLWDPHQCWQTLPGGQDGLGGYDRWIIWEQTGPSNNRTRCDRAHTRGTSCSSGSWWKKAPPARTSSRSSHRCLQVWSPRASKPIPCKWHFSREGGWLLMFKRHWIFAGTWPEDSFLQP